MTPNPGDYPWQVATKVYETDEIAFVTIPVDLQAQSAPSFTTSPIVISQNCNSQVPFHQVIAHNRDRESAVSGSNPGNCNETSRDSELKDVFDVQRYFIYKTKSFVHVILRVFSLVNKLTTGLTYVKLITDRIL